MRRAATRVAALCLMLLAGSAAAAPRIAIIIDDLGYNRAAGEAVLALPAPLTCAVIPETPHGRRLAREAAAAGKEVMIHLPMATLDARRLDAGALHDGMSEAQIGAVLDRAQRALPDARGLNNHMGSALTAEAEPMRRLMEQLRHRHLYFIDSRTNAATVAERSARQAGLAAGRRDVFLDNQRDLLHINAQFNRLLRLARRHGQAIAIGHPYPETLDYLRQVLPLLDQAGVRLVPVSQLLTAPVATAGAAARPGRENG
ncbi:divergent polysaccharide deacetylase family protein [Alcanivorax marinus]|uniref:Divergent polysaccharide deacetylase family protein n=1 Tax=Alloalcanivorax marinus TaxID=1177169 RepID=A0A9Q3UM99_9GAMM|nr:divergent polysaccharide deacetylase family protein [Alloalcanivorax marinus]MCC4308363.1 divergent polysaccharide deacetylase family protein [Alloalcanivorax marinus]